MSEAVRLSVQGGVATISLNRPQVMKAMDGDMMQRPLSLSQPWPFFAFTSRTFASLAVNEVDRE
jgi:hypothetical protein